MVIEIPYPKDRKQKTAWSKRYGMNAYYSGKPWQVRKRDAEYWHWLTAAALKKPKLYDHPVEISFWWNDGLDLDNHAAIAKMITDALKGRVIRDDSRRYVQRITHQFWDEDKIKISIEEIKP